MKVLYITLYIFVLLVYYTIKIDASISQGNKQILHTGIDYYEQDYGAEGSEDDTTLNLLKSVQNGSVIIVTVLIDKKGTIKFYDDENDILFLMILRSDENPTDGGINVSSSVIKCAKNTILILYEEKEYKIFVNGKSYTFSNLNSTQPVRRLDFSFDKLYKIFYLTTEEVH